MVPSLDRYPGLMLLVSLGVAKLINNVKINQLVAMITGVVSTRAGLVAGC